MFARSPRFMFDFISPPSVPLTTDTYRKTMQQFMEHTLLAARNSNLRHQLKAKQRYDSNRPNPQYYIGQNVIIRNRSLAMNKFSSKFIGPYTNVKQVNNKTYVVQNTKNNQQTPITVQDLRSIYSCPNTSWLKNFVGLETIEYTITDRCTKVNLLVWPQALKYLKIVYEDYRDCILIQQSLTDLSQLNDLEVYQKQPGGSLPRGEIWTQIISASVPSLKNFKFYFQFICHKHQLNQLKEVVASFSTRFYKLEKNLIVRCDVSDRYETIFHDVEYDTNNTNMRRVILYTIPFGFEVFTVFKTFLKSKILDWPRNYIDYRSTIIHKMYICEDYDK
ncbi:unnamed protein product [Rotaria magnacalcarata]|uniref:Uncharacterized protein n=1 Tax=Rotaria magnacalcarata TaxID=392030 RepID=A0A816EMG1_9BILA|nr:unnamed protein product [Rotaria magnacalcarata]